ncbi:MAG: DNA (cytosine-5-)-methyltransferase [Lachnospiraceae bacterium]|nr:DNA (cytosine-5-)-methyltransferase [Lachnospiraceae bacterium]
MPKKVVKFIDLFSGMGGIRLGFEQAFKKAGYNTKCVLTSEIKEAAIKAHELNFPGEVLEGDVTKIATKDIEDFDFLLAGFPCQAFSVAGKQRGFADTRGTLFFEVERILRDKKPYGFILENVEGLVTHDKENASDKIGRTLSTIIHSLETMGYEVNWKVLDAKNFGLAQTRNRIYIVGTLKDKISLDNFKKKTKSFGRIQENGLPTVDDAFTQALLAIYQPQELYGKSIKDKRGGENNIHSWELGIRGQTTVAEKNLLNRLLKERRKKHWAEVIGIDWMDGMPLTVEQIRTFYDSDQLEDMLQHLLELGYLVYEHPKKKVTITNEDGRSSSERVPDESKPKGYNIVTGKLSFEFSQILDPFTATPTMVAMDMERVGVVDGNGIRRLTLNEGLALFGYPKKYSLEIYDTESKRRKAGFDLLGNTVCVPVIQAVAERVAVSYTNHLESIGGEKDAK